MLLTQIHAVPAPHLLVYLSVLLAFDAVEAILAYIVAAITSMRLEVGRCGPCALRRQRRYDRLRSQWEESVVAGVVVGSYARAYWNPGSGTRVLVAPGTCAVSCSCAGSGPKPMALIAAD